MVPRVLIIAEAANPDWVSVPLVGWSLAKALRGVVDVHVVTQVRNKEAIEAQGWVEGQDFTAIDSEALARPLWKLGEKLRMGEGKGWTMVQAISAISYPHFERLVWRKFGPAIRRGDYDIVHRVTPLSPTISSSLARKCRSAGVPFVLGPLNGGVPWPKWFEAERRREREWLSYVRGLYRLGPARKSRLKAASAILAGSRHTASELPREVADRVIWCPENAIDPGRFHRTAPHDPGGLRACFIGRLVAYKGCDMLLEAARPLLEAGRMELQIVGDGPERERLEAMAGKGVTFHGWLPHEKVQDVLAESTLFSFPSIREFGGGVVLEAMATGVPPLIVDYAGPGELVTEGLGWKVPIGPRDQIITAFRAELDRLADDPGLLKEVGGRAKAHVQDHFTWAAKAGQVAQVYDWVLNGGQRPDLFA